MPSATEPYWSHSDFSACKSIEEPTPRQQQLRDKASDRFGVLSSRPHALDDSSTDHGDEEQQEEEEMGLTATAMEHTEKECKEQLATYLHRPCSVKRRGTAGGMSFREWCLALRLIAEDFGGVGALESQQAIKGVKRCDGMRLMYGAIRAPLIQEMVRFARVTKGDRFVDIGSGLGTVVLQMAAVAGCQATGIELDEL